MIKKALIGLAAIAAACGTATNSYSHVDLHPRVESAARYLYHNSTNEWVLCMRGAIANDTLFVDRAELPQIQAASPISVSYVPCNVENYVGTIHPHRNGVPMPSTNDIASWRTHGGEAHLIMVGNNFHVWRETGNK